MPSFKRSRVYLVRQVQMFGERSRNTLVNRTLKCSVFQCSVFKPPPPPNCIHLNKTLTYIDDGWSSIVVGRRHMNIGCRAVRGDKVVGSLRQGCGSHGNHVGWLASADRQTLGCSGSWNHCHLLLRLAWHAHHCVRQDGRLLWGRRLLLLLLWWLWSLVTILVRYTGLIDNNGYYRHRRCCCDHGNGSW